MGSLHLKLDGFSSSPFGGNKVRKLEFLLGKAKQNGAKTIFTFGYEGSNHCVATASLAARLGLNVFAQVLEQEPQPYVRKNVQMAKKMGAVVNLYQSEFGLRLGTAALYVREKLSGNRPMLIPPGGSEALGVMGFVNAALELQSQLERCQLPVPDRIYCAISSGGTTAGLRLGMDLLGWKTELHAVRVYGTVNSTRKKLEQLTRKSHDLLKSKGLRLQRMQRLVIRDEFIGQGYAFSTKGGLEAQKRMEARGIALDPTYTAKAYACLLADLRAGELKSKQVLFWNSLNQDQTKPIEGLIY